MTIKEALNEARIQLSKCNVETPGLTSGVLLTHVLGCDRSWLVAHGNEELPGEKMGIFQSYIARAISGEPISYITGSKEFLSMNFEVGRGVLIPRPETELLVEIIIEYVTGNFDKDKQLSILDICTGSGCIAISLTQILRDKGYNCRSVGIDISDEALHFAMKNASLHRLEDFVSFVKRDIFQETSLPEFGFDIVVSNPPYITSNEIASLDPNVRDFEPVSALDGGRDGLDFYRRIISIAPRLLNHKGALFFEVGYDQALKVKAMMECYFSNINIKKDYSGIDRIVLGML